MPYLNVERDTSFLSSMHHEHFESEINEDAHSGIFALKCKTFSPVRNHASYCSSMVCNFHIVQVISHFFA